MLRPDITFLNHGSFGAIPRRVYASQDEWRRRIEAEPIELLGTPKRQWFALNQRAKEGVGPWLGMRPDDFGFVTNATEGVNAVLQSLRLNPGDELVATDHVYGAVRQAMKHTAERSGATYREIPIPLPVGSTDDLTAAVLAGVTPRTQLLVVDHVTSPTALVFPVAQIVAGCADLGVDVLIDGAHAPGMLDLDVSRIGAAYYAGNLHKWVCGPKGSAFLYVRPDRQADVHPATISHFWRDGFGREFAWQGTRDFSAWLAAPDAFAFMAELGWDRVRAHNHAMAVWAHEMLCRRLAVEPISPLDGSLLGSMATVPLPPPLDGMSQDQGDALSQRLYDEFRLEVPFVRWGARWFVRVSCQVYNTPEQYEYVAKVISGLR